MNKGLKAHLDWEEAEEHLHEIEQSYLEVMGLPGNNTAVFFTVILPNIRGRWNSGVRDRRLYDDIMGLKL